MISESVRTSHKNNEVNAITMVKTMRQVQIYFDVCVTIYSSTLEWITSSELWIITSESVRTSHKNNEVNAIIMITIKIMFCKTMQQVQIYFDVCLTIHFSTLEWIISSELLFVKVVCCFNVFVQLTQPVHVCCSNGRWISRLGLLKKQASRNQGM